MPPTTLITFLLDRSQSMSTCRDATIEAFNGYLDGLRAERAAQISFTLLQFDSISLDKCHLNAPIERIPNLTYDTFVPRGSTPLIDSAMATIRAVEGALAVRTDNPKVVICFQTDGEENYSKSHTWEELRALVAAKTEIGWQFNFMGAGIDGFKQAGRMGVSYGNTVSYDSTDAGATRAVFAASAGNMADFAAGRALDTAYTAQQRAASGEARVVGKAPDVRTFTFQTSGTLDLRATGVNGPHFTGVSRPPGAEEMARLQQAAARRGTT